MGRIEEAKNEFEEALRRNPDDSAALSGLARLVTDGHYRFSDEQVRRIEKLVATPDLPLEDQFRYHQALAWVYDKAGDYEKAFMHCRLFKGMRRELDSKRSQGFDPDEHRQLIDRNIAAYRPAWFERVKSFGSDSDRPIFVIGMMRSGTTLAEQILASHPRVFGAGELPDMERLFSALPVRMGLAQDPLDCLGMLDASLVRSLADEYLLKLRQLDSKAMPRRGQDAVQFHAPGICRHALSSVRFIHCRRNAVDTCVSAYFQNFKVPHPYTLDLRHLGLYYREYERIMEHWARVLPVPVFDLHYEELTADQEATSRRLLDYCGLEWDDRCLRFNETQRVVRTASTLQVRQSMYRTSVGKWKRYEAYIQPLLEGLGRED